MTHAPVIQAVARCWPRLMLCFLGVVPTPRLPSVTQVHGGNALLRDLTGLAAVAEDTSPEARFLGITEEWLVRRVSARLRSAGVPVLERSDALSSEREPLVVVRFQTLRVPDRLVIAWHLSLAVHQRVATLGARPDTALAQTWAASAVIGVTSERTLRSSVGESLDAQTEELVRAWGRRTGGE